MQWQELVKKLQGLMRMLAQQLLRNAELACAELVALKASPHSLTPKGRAVSCW